MTRWQKIILGSLSLILLTLVGVLAYVLATAPSLEVSSSTPVPRPTYTVLPAAVTAQSAFELAKGTALAWQPDAALVSASAVWRKTSLEEMSQPVAWNYQFFSPGTQSLYLVIVRDGQARGIRESASPYQLATIDEEAWKVDSHQALSAWLNGGGATFLRQHPLLDVQAKLSVRQGNLLWTVSGTDAIEPVGMDVVVEATAP